MACVTKRRGKWILDYRDQQGKRHWETTNGNRKQAGLLLAQRLQEIGRHEYQPRSEQKTFDELADAYLAGHVRVNVRASTAKSYEGDLNRHILPYFKGRKIREITPDDIDHFKSHLLEKEIKRKRKNEIVINKGVGRRTVNKCLTLLSMMFRYALRYRWMSYNPAAEVKKLRYPTIKHDLIDENTLTPDEINRLLDKADGRWWLLIMTAIYTGMRQGELLGLQWGDIDWNTKEIYVRRTFSDGRFSEPKTRSSRRRIRIDETLVQELKHWKLQCPKGELELVFPNGAGNPENHGNLLNRGFYPALRRAGLRKIRFHDLRHTYVSLLIASGVDVKTASILAGHSSIKITLDIYGHLYPNSFDGIAERLHSLIKSGSKMVANDKTNIDDNLQVLDLMVARGGIEPPTQGFSVPCSTD